MGYVRFHEDKLKNIGEILSSMSSGNSSVKNYATAINSGIRDTLSNLNDAIHSIGQAITLCKSAEETLNNAEKELTKFINALKVHNGKLIKGLQRTQAAIAEIEATIKGRQRELHLAYEQRRSCQPAYRDDEGNLHDPDEYKREESERQIARLESEIRSQNNKLSEKRRNEKLFLDEMERTQVKINETNESINKQKKLLLQTKKNMSSLEEAKDRLQEIINVFESSAKNINLAVQNIVAIIGIMTERVVAEYSYSRQYFPSTLSSVNRAADVNTEVLRQTAKKMRECADKIIASIKSQQIKSKRIDVWRDGIRMEIESMVEKDMRNIFMVCEQLLTKAKEIDNKAEALEKYLETVG